jgi:hypothetical protein
MRPELSPEHTAAKAAYPSAGPSPRSQIAFESLSTRPRIRSSSAYSERREVRDARGRPTATTDLVVWAENRLGLRSRAAGALRAAVGLSVDALLLLPTGRRRPTH